MGTVSPTKTLEAADEQRIMKKKSIFVQFDPSSSPQVKHLVIKTRYFSVLVNRNSNVSKLSKQTSFRRTLP